MTSCMWETLGRSLLTGSLLLVTSDLCITMAILQLQALPHLVNENGVLCVHT